MNWGKPITTRNQGREGIALIPVILVISGLAVFTMALVTTVLSGKRTVIHQEDDHRLSSTAESAAILAAEALWTGYLTAQGGAAGDITSFRTYLTLNNIPHDVNFDFSNPKPPGPNEGVDFLAQANIPGAGVDPELNNAQVNALRIVRRDVGDSTQLYITTQVTSNRGRGTVDQALNRAVQQVYTIEPADFDGFDFALLANNVNCIFCHATVDSVDRYFNDDPSNYGSFERVKVGTLESLMLRHNRDGNIHSINDNDTDSFLAGTLYSRGPAMLDDGTPIAMGDWADLTFQAFGFDSDGNILQDIWGQMNNIPFAPSSNPGPGENLYLNYSEDYTQMVDGPLPTAFPAPIPDDGGSNPSTGLPDPNAVGNRIIDDVEFDTLASSAEGVLSGYSVNVTDPSDQIDTLQEFQDAFFDGNTQGALTDVVSGNVVLYGTEDEPIRIDGSIAIDGDLVITGYVEGEGSLIVRGNVYIPSDLRYKDGRRFLPGDAPDNPTGPRTFGMGQDLTPNALGLASGGNILIGDFQKPMRLQPDYSSHHPGELEYTTGEVDEQWSFALAELSLFNRGEWARTQPMLPGSPGEANQDPSTWTAVNPDYDPDYIPRYYGHGDGTMIPIHNRGNLYFDATTETWIVPVHEEVPLYWNSEEHGHALLSYADPTNANDPLLFSSDGSSRAVVSTLTPTGGWLKDSLLKKAVWYFEGEKSLADPIHIDGLLYTNNAIFSLVSRFSRMKGQMILNGSLVAADVGMLVPGIKDRNNVSPNHSPISEFATGLQLNYDPRVRELLNVRNPYQVQLKRTLWNPTSNIL